MEKSNVEKVSGKILEQNKRLEEEINEKNCYIEFLESKIKELENYAMCSDENVSEMNHKIKRLEDELEESHADKLEQRSRLRLRKC